MSKSCLFCSEDGAVVHANRKALKIVTRGILENWCDYLNEHPLFCTFCGKHQIYDSKLKSIPEPKHEADCPVMAAIHLEEQMYTFRAMFDAFKKGEF